MLSPIDLAILLASLRNLRNEWVRLADHAAATHEMKMRALEQAVTCNGHLDVLDRGPTLREYTEVASWMLTSATLGMHVRDTLTVGERTR